LQQFFAVAFWFAALPLGAFAQTPPNADLSIVQTTQSATVGRGQSATYSIVVTNNGPSATQATILERIPGITTLRSVNAPSDVSCAQSGGEAQAFTCSVASLAVGATRTIAVVVDVAAAAPAGSSTSATAQVFGSNDSNTANNSSSATFTVAESADLALSIGAAAPTTAPGGDITYTLVATNNGPSSTTPQLDQAIATNTAFKSMSSPSRRRQRTDRVPRIEWHGHGWNERVGCATDGRAGE
jgi:uncharacterized repeat protein (TIGR01451 family)